MATSNTMPLHTTALAKILNITKPRFITMEEISKARSTIRQFILTEGISVNDHISEQPLRPLVWKILLSLPADISAASYAQVVSFAPSSAYEKIRNDAFRTLATDESFKKKVGEESLVRLLEAFVWMNIDSQNSKMSTLVFSYVQGMNVLAAPFLYTLPSELEAFFSFSKFVKVYCPTYVQPTLEGVHRGLQLLDRCLGIIDNELYLHLQSKGLSAEIYAFPSVLTFSACTPPLDQVLHLWDFLLAYGVHMNILCIIAQLWLFRDKIISHSNPMKLLRTLPPLQARQCIMLACQFVSDIPSELYDELARHTWTTRVTAA